MGLQAETTRTRQPRWHSRPDRKAASRAAAQARHFAPGDAVRATAPPAAPSRRASTRSRWRGRNSRHPSSRHPRWPLQENSGRLCLARQGQKPEPAEAPSRRQTTTEMCSATTGRPRAPPAPRAGRWSGPRPGKPSASSLPPRPPAGAWAALSTDLDTRHLPLAGAVAVRRSCRPPAGATNSPGSSTTLRNIRSAGTRVPPLSRRGEAPARGPRTATQTPLERLNLRH
jgi:hypothetical protein